MKQISAFLFFALVLTACGNDNSGAKLEDPANTQPPSEAIPDSMKIVQDSAIVPDTVPDSSAQMGTGDSVHRNP